LVTPWPRCMRRPDEATEFLALWWKDGRGATAKLSSQVKRGLRLAFAEWDEYRLAKYAGAGDKIKLRDALFLSHAKPKDEEQAALWKRLVAGELEAPDTWEVALSAGTDKHETWERLLREKKLGYQALLMNLRNMVAAGADAALVREALLAGRGRERMFPYRFLAAARYAPQFADVLSEAMVAGLAGHEKLSGSTVLLVDVSGSMDERLSAKGEMQRHDAAGCLAVILREISEPLRVFTFSNAVVEIANHRGLALSAAISGSQQHGGTYLSAALDKVRAAAPAAHRVIVVTDEQSHDGIAVAWAPHSYLFNVAPYKPGLDTSRGWTRINGWSDRVVDWMAMEEAST
jgi:60 kDa SS-A/Ro ribonucleoprotein